MFGLARRFALVVAAIGFILAIATAGYVLIDHYPLFDAFYMALTTILTVGYGEIHPLSHAGRVFNVFILIFGVSTLLLAIGAMTQTIIELQFGNILDRRRTRKMIDRLNQHFIVCGFGRVGRGAAAELKDAGVSVVVVDSSEERVERAIRAGFLAVQADATRDETLRDVQIERAQGLIAALSTDANNLFAVISAKTINPRIRVVARAAEEEAEAKLRRVGADAVYAPYTITGVRLAQALLRPHVFQFLDFATTSMHMDVRIEQLAVAPSSDLAGKTLGDSRLRKDLNVVVLAIRRTDGTMLFNPPADARIAGGDFLIVMGEPEPLRNLERRVAGVAA
jgi:voltage-gated potassium channel